FIIFTTLNMSVDDQRRQIAFYRTVGLTRGQIGCSIMFESLVLALPGWLIGITTGWLLLWLGTGKILALNGSMTGFSFLCAVFGAVVAALYPMLLGMQVSPLEAVRREPGGLLCAATRKGRFAFLVVCFLLGIVFLSADLYLVYILPMETAKKAFLHSGLGVMSLALGAVCLIPVFISLVEVICLPVLAILFRFDSNLLRGELSGNMRRTTAVTVVLGIGGGLFVSMQIWGYSMLGPFLPGREMPDAFAAFLPVGLQSQFIEELRTIPGVKSDEFLPVAVEQAAFAKGSVAERGGMSGQFANLVFFGMDIPNAFCTARPLVELHFVQGDRTTALSDMKNNRGVVITDSVSVDYKLNVGDVLKVQHPRRPEAVLEYPVVGVVSFPGWQWLSKTGGVRRNFGRSGGIAFADEKTILSDYQLDRFSYFWFNTKEKTSAADLEKALDTLAQKNLRSPSPNVLPAEKRSSLDSGQAAYVKLSTRESLLNSISRRADSVIWALSKMPLMTLVITSVAVVAVIINSVRSRRRLFGMLRAVGMTRFAIVRMILVESILIGIVASISSFLFGFLAACGALKLGQSMFGTVDPPLVLPWNALAFGLVLTVALCLTAAVYPAIATGRQAPLELLQEGRDAN
ncbi:MAG: FtsX-like permease family protein, partial [Thermoguttaceae bacterium]|nr:FtsX-like permease family protein [Thermoguttaceae bacterium]